MKGITDLIRISVYKVLLPALFTAVLLIASISVCGKPAQAQSAAQTVADLLDGVSIPGLDSLPVSNLQITDSYKSADVTLHGKTATIVVFKPDGADKNIVAVVPNDFSLGDFVPLPSGTPLDDVTFSDMALIIAQADISLTVADAPTPLNAALSHGSDTVTLKQGVNLFGEADFSASGTVKDLLSNVGITDLTLPLNGGLPTNLFSQNPKTAAQNFKNQILDNFALNIPLPAISIPNMPDTITIKNSRLSIKSANVNGNRTVDVDVAGELDVKAAGQTVDFDYDVEIKKTSGKPGEIQIIGHTEPGKTLSVSLLEKFTISDLSFIHSNRGNWAWQISGKSTFRSKSLNVIYLPNHSLLVDVYGKLNLAEVAGVPTLPVVDDIKVGNFAIYKNFFRVAMTIKGVGVGLDLWKPRGSSKFYTGFFMGPSF